MGAPATVKIGSRPAHRFEKFSVASMALAAWLVVAVGAGCASQTSAKRACAATQPFVRTLPDTREYIRLLGNPDSLCLHSGLVTLMPGASCGWHSTERFEEMIICLAGAGLVESADGDSRRLSAGQYAYNPPHTRHNVSNTGMQVMRYIYVVAPTEPPASQPASDAGRAHQH